MILDTLSPLPEGQELNNILENNESFTYPVKWSDRYCLLFSSLFFFIPAIHAFWYNAYFHGFMSIITGCASINFWWSGIPDWRLTLDKTVAYSTTVVYISTGILHVINDDIQGNYIYPLLYIFFCVFAANAYSMSCEKWNIGCPSWVNYHMMFHVFLSCGKCAVIQVISNNFLENCNPEIDYMNRFIS